MLACLIRCTSDEVHSLSDEVHSINPFETTYIRVSQPWPSAPVGATERFSGGHEQRPLLNSSAAILQNPKQS